MRKPITREDFNKAIKALDESPRTEPPIIYQVKEDGSLKKIKASKTKQK